MSTAVSADVTFLPAQSF